MKKIKYILPLVATLFLTASCDEEDYRNPSEIVDEYISEHKELLTSSEQGWRFDYSPDTSQYGVYTFLMKFHENGRVSMQTDKNFFYLYATEEEKAKEYAPQESDYTIQHSEAPVLTFATYNLITKLADPQLNVPGYGWGGENDFIIMGHSEEGDTIYLKSLKAQKKCFLVKNTMDWEEYFNGVNEVIETFEAGNSYFRDIEVEGCKPAVMTDFNMTTRMGVVYQYVGDKIQTSVCRFRFTPDEIRLESPLHIGDDVKISHFKHSATSGDFLVNGVEGSTIKNAENGRPKMTFDVREKVFKGIFEEEIDGIMVERDDMYQFDIHPEACNDLWIDLAKNIKNYLYMLVVPGYNKDYYVGLYAELPDASGRTHTVIAQVQINYTWSTTASDEMTFRGIAASTLLFAGTDTETGDFAVNTPLAKEFKEQVGEEFQAYLNGVFGSNRERVNCVVVPSADDTYFSFVNKETGGYLGIMKAY